MLSEKRASFTADAAPLQAISANTSDAPPPPKARRLNGVAAPRRAVEMNRLWINYLENVLEEENFSEALLAMETMIGRWHLPPRAHIRQLLALSLSPSSCLRTPKASSTAQQKGGEPKLKAPTIDPLPATARKIRLLALRLLENVASTLSGDAIFRALRHYGVDEELMPPPKVVLDKKGNPVLPEEEEEEEEEETTEEEHTPLVLAGKRVGACDDVWTLLGGGAEKTRQMRNEEQPMAPGAWELLRTLVGVWEGEAARRSEAGELAVSPSLLQNLKSNSSGAREVSPKVLDLLAWPFRYLNGEDVPEEGSGVEDEEAEERKKAALPVDSDELTIAEKQAVSMRLFALLAQAVNADKLSAHSMLHETTLRLKGFSSESFAAFVECLPDSAPQFAVRLCTYYLESQSLATPTSSNGSPPPTASPSRRRTLGACVSSASLSSVTTSTDAGASKVPLPTASELLALLAKLPSDFPLLPTSTSTLDALDVSAAAAKPRRAPTAKQPLSFGRIAQSCSAHALLKQALLESVWGVLEGDERRVAEKGRLEEVLLVEGEAGRVLREVEEKVEQARERIEASGAE